MADAADMDEQMKQDPESWDDWLIEQALLQDLYGSKIRGGYTPPFVYLKFIDEKIGWGVFAHSKILKGIYIGEYTGIVQVYNKAGDNGYMCNYEAAPYPYKFRTVIDARPYGNITRFINHSERNANIEWKEVLYDGLYHIILVASKDIEPHQQLLVDYGKQYWSKRDSKPAFEDAM